MLPFNYFWVTLESHKTPSDFSFFAFSYTAPKKFFDP